MRLTTMLAVIIIALSASAYAQGRGNGHAKRPAASAPRAKTTARPAKTAAKAETRPVKAETRAGRSTAKVPAHAAKTETKAARKSGTTPAATTVVTLTTPTTSVVRNPKLEARLLTLLPAGSNVQDAAQGFKNWGQFVAAAHVSNNLNIPFADLKMAMTGVMPGTSVPAATPMSLGQAIQSLKGTTSIQTEVKKAEGAANVDLRRSRDRS